MKNVVHHKLVLSTLLQAHEIKPDEILEFGLAFLEEGLALYDVKDDVDYQREHKWTDAQQSLFMGHVLTGGIVQPIVWNSTGGILESDVFEVVDGKQRLRALRRWIADEIPAEVESTGQRFYLHDTTGRIPHDIRIKVWVVRLDRAGVLKLYLRLNTGGTPHTPEEIEKVRALLAATT